MAAPAAREGVALLDCDLRLREGSVHLSEAGGQFQRQIAAHILPDQCGSLQRLLGSAHRVERLAVDDNKVQPVGQRLSVICQYHGDRLAHVPHHIGCQRREASRLQPGRHGRRRHQTRHLRQVRRGVYRCHAR